MKSKQTKSAKKQPAVKSKVAKPKIKRIAFRSKKKKGPFSSMWYMIAGFIVISIVWNMFSSALDASEIGVNQFISNIKDDKYAIVDIRDDGRIVGTQKFINVAEISQESSFSENEDISVKNLEKAGFTKVTVDELVQQLKPLEFSELIEKFKNRDTSRINSLYVGETFIIADDLNDINDDYYVVGTSKEAFLTSLTENSLNVADVEAEIFYLQTVAKESSVEEINYQIKNTEVDRIWVLEDIIVSRLDASEVNKDFIWDISKADFLSLLQQEDISLDVETTKIVTTIIPRIPWGDIFTLLMLVGFGILAFSMFKGIQGSGSNLVKFGKSKARMILGRKPDVTFNDVAGVDEAKEELAEIVLFLKEPKRFLKLGARIPKGVLMVGAPGTGKTLLARAIAGEAGVPFFHTSGSEFEEMLVGAGASRVRDLFEKAKKAAPSIIFIDEIDAVARKRGTTIQSGTTEQTLNQILVEMDGFEKNSNVIVIAATNRPDVLDKAILRPGRFDRRIMLDLPDIVGRKQIIAIHAKNKPIAPSVDLLQLAKRTVGFSGADLENMLNEAAIITAKASRKEITAEDLEEAATKVQIGPARKRKRTEKELKMTAYHEAGHAIVMKKSPEHDPVHRVTIVSRGMALGYTMPLPVTDELQLSKIKMISKITALVAGFVTEEMVFGDVTSGAANDIEKASNLARQMVKSFGMSKKMGLVKYGQGDNQQYLGYSYEQSKNYSETTAREIDEEVKKIIDSCYAEAKNILKKNRKTLDEIVDTLLEKEVLDAKDFEAFFK